MGGYVGFEGMTANGHVALAVDMKLDVAHDDIVVGPGGQVQRGAAFMLGGAGLGGVSAELNRWGIGAGVRKAIVKDRKPTAEIRDIGPTRVELDARGIPGGLENQELIRVRGKV